MIKHVIFDFDGTLAASIDYNLMIVNRLSQKFGFRVLSKKELQNLKFRSMREIMKEFKIPLYKVPMLIYNLRKQPAEEFIEAAKPFDGTRNMLILLKKKGYSLHILSTASESNIVQFLEKYNLNHFEDIKAQVPIYGKSSALNILIKKLKIDKSECIYVGDETRDITAAKKAGAKIISVAYGFNSEKLLAKEHPDFIAQEPSDIPIILNTLKFR
ncbi:MAG: HAD-IA family hydrolase [archaeon]